MTAEIEFKKKNLEHAEKNNPLQEHWLKKDFVQPSEAVLIYYGVSPSSNSMGIANEQTIQMVDWQGLYDVLLSSKFFLHRRGAFELPEFIEWLVEKGFEIPKHLQNKEQHNATGDEVDEDKEISVELSSIRLPVLIGEVARRLMVKLAKDPRYQGKAATDIIREAKEFKTLRTLVSLYRDGKDYSDTQYQRWTSSSGPRARK